MKFRLTVVVVFFLMLTGCNLPSNQTTPTPLPLLTQPTVAPSSTPIPIETLLTFELPTVTPTQTPPLVLAIPKTGPVNCRSGPGISYNVMSELPVGRRAE